MLSSVEQAFVGRQEIRAPLKTPAWEASQCQAENILVLFFLKLYTVNPLLSPPSTGLLIFRGKKAKFCGIFRGKFAEKSADFVEKKSKFAEKSADFTGFSWEKSQNSQKNRPILRDFSGKGSNFKGFSGANS